jgi:hypothetical protein
MPDFRKIVRERIATLGLTPAAESDLTEELAQQLADHYQELRGGGAAEEEAYQSAISELDDLYRMRAELKGISVCRGMSLCRRATSRGGI